MTTPPAAAPKAIIFDLLTALLDSWSLWDVCAGSSVTGRIWRKKYLELTFAQGRYHDYADMVARAAREIRSARTPEGSELPSSAPTELIRRMYGGEIRAWPEVPGCLRRLRQRYPETKVGVITNCSVELGRKVAAGSCENDEFHFDAVITAEEVGWYKPDPRAYGAIVDALAVPREECLFVAGSAGDVVGASRAGLRVVWHNHVGLEAQRDADRNELVRPEVEGRTLTEVLEGVGLI